MATAIGNGRALDFGAGHDGVPASGVPRPRHIPALDGLRGIAILLVLVVHAVRLPATEIGFAGVDLFFVLSGFLITGTLLDAKGSPHYFRNFYARRTLRIFPLYYLALALLMWFGPADHRSAFAEQQGWHWTYLVNLQIAQPGIGPLPLTGHFWSLAVEEQFYLVWPLLVWWLSRRDFARSAWAIVIGAALLRVTLHVGEAVAGASVREAVYVLTVTRADALAIGALVALYWRAPGGLAWMARWIRPVAIASASVLAAIWLLRGEVLYSDRPVQIVGFSALAFLGAGVIVASLVRLESGRRTPALESRWLRFFGKYSYAIYIVHPTVLYMLERSLLSARPDWGSRLLALGAMTAVSVALALVSWHLVEAPMLSLKRHFASGA